MHVVHFSRGYVPVGLRFELLAKNVTRDHFTDGGEWELTSGVIYNGSKTTPPPFKLIVSLRCTLNLFSQEDLIFMY